MGPLQKLLLTFSRKTSSEIFFKLCHPLEYKLWQKEGLVPHELADLVLVPVPWSGQLPGLPHGAGHQVEYNSLTNEFKTNYNSTAHPKVHHGLNEEEQLLLDRDQGETPEHVLDQYELEQESLELILGESLTPKNMMSSVTKAMNSVTMIRSQSIITTSKGGCVGPQPYRTEYKAGEKNTELVPLKEENLLSEEAVHEWCKTPLNHLMLISLLHNTEKKYFLDTDKHAKRNKNTDMDPEEENSSQEKAVFSSHWRHRKKDPQLPLADPIALQQREVVPLDKLQVRQEELHDKPNQL
jgi:hypothetical protein